MTNSDFILAVHALVFLNHKAQTLTSDELAENICTNPARVRRVMASLQKAGLVITREGRRNGGYCFPHPPQSVSLYAVAQALKTCFVAADWRSGDPHMKCRVASGIAGIMDEVLGDLNEACLQRLKDTNILDLDQKLFPDLPE